MGKVERKKSEMMDMTGFSISKRLNMICVSVK